MKIVLSKAAFKIIFTTHFNTFISSNFSIKYLYIYKHLMYRITSEYDEPSSQNSHTIVSDNDNRTATEILPDGTINISFENDTPRCVIKKLIERGISVNQLVKIDRDITAARAIKNFSYWALW